MTKRKPKELNSNTSPHSPFKDEDDESKTFQNKDRYNLSRNYTSGNGELPKTTTAISQNYYNHHKTNTKSSPCNVNYESWDTTIGTSQYREDDPKGIMEPDIIPFQTQKLNSEVKNCKNEIKQLLMLRK